MEASPHRGRCSNSKCPRGDAEVQLACRCGENFCTEACWIQFWHAGHQHSCPYAADIVSDASEHCSQRRGAALLASMALTRRKAESFEGAEVEQLRNLERSRSSRFRRAFSQSSKASSWVSLAEAESLPDPEGISPCSCTADDFDVLDKLGAGSCGSVSKVSHKFTGEVYALKTVPLRLVKEKHLHDHIEREVAIQKQLKHPNIVQLYEYFEDKEHVYLLLEFAADGSLFSKIHQQNCLSHAEAASVFTDVSEALAHLHRHGIAHRDLKPENVLLFPGGRAKLADFGWCAQLTSDGRKTFCGTMDYLSPEMVSQEPHDHRVDIWALGVLLYEMLTGDPPFAGRNNAHVLGRILSVDIIMPVSIPEGAADLIHALLKASPQERLTLDAALKWAWLKDMRTDPLETEEEVAIPVDALECSESTERLLLEVPSAMHLYPQPKSSSRRNSPRAELGEGAGWLPCKLGEPDVLNPGQPFLLARQSSKSFKGSKSKDCFGSALRPYQANWEVPSCEAASGLSPDHCAAGGPKEKGSFAGGAFLLSSCLKPASGLQLRHEDSSLSLCGAVPKVQSWADTDLYVSVRSWVRQAEPALSYGKEVDPALSMSKASGSEVARRQHNSSLDSSLACSPPQSLSTFSESSQLSFDCVDSVDADAATDTEGDARNLAMPFYTEGCTTKANATKARVIK